MINICLSKKINFFKKKIYIKKKIRIDQLINNIFPKISRTIIKKNIINNKLYINNKLINKPDKKILIYNKIIKIDFFLSSEINKNIFKPEKKNLNFIEINKNYLILNKPYNLVVEAGNKNTLINALAYYYPENFYLPKYGIVHRLDKNTTGLMVIARNINTYIYLKNLFKTHNIKRFYDTIIYGRMSKKTGIINLPILRHPIKKICMTINIFGKRAITIYRVKEVINKFSRLNLNLLTGKTHQIRVHLSYLNHPILGDKLYFINKYLNLANKINVKIPLLHSYKLGFKELSTGLYREWNVPLPNKYKKILSQLKYIYC